MKNIIESKMSTCKIHNIRFYNLKPRAISCICYEKSSKKLALSRLVQPSPRLKILI